jgi:hypothetical protein
MFRNRALQLKWTKVDPAEENGATNASKNSPETAVIEVVKESTKYALIMFAGYKTLDTVSKIAMITVDNKTK